VKTLLSVADKIAWQPVLIAGFELVALVLLWIWVWNRRQQIPTAVQFVLIVLTARFLLFGTPLSWFAYYATLDPAFIDFRERDLVANKVKTFLAPPAEQKFVAVGSSQTRAVYSQFSKNNPVLGYYSLAGMGPADYVEEYGEILKRRPKVILLYLSEFDLARPVDLTNSRLSDLPIREWPEFFRLVASVKGVETAKDTLVAMTVADLFPENKYSFLVADYTKQLLSHIAGDPVTVPTIAEQTRVQTASLKSLRADAVPEQMIFLEAFLRLTERDRLPVVLVEGQYNPVAYTSANIRMNRDVIAPDLAELKKKFANVVVVSRAEASQFTQSDYEDDYHVKPEAGERFAAHLLRLLAGKVTLSRLQ
jgi:hypothetical protein